MYDVCVCFFSSLFFVHSLKAISTLEDIHIVKVAFYEFVYVVCKKVVV